MILLDLVASVFSTMTPRYTTMSCMGRVDQSQCCACYGRHSYASAHLLRKREDGRNRERPNRHATCRKNDSRDWLSVVICLQKGARSTSMAGTKSTHSVPGWPIAGQSHRSKNVTEADFKVRNFVAAANLFCRNSPRCRPRERRMKDKRRRCPLPRPSQRVHGTST